MKNNSPATLQIYINHGFNMTGAIARVNMPSYFLVHGLANLPLLDSERGFSLEDVIPIIKKNGGAL